MMVWRDRRRGVRAHDQSPERAAFKLQIQLKETTMRRMFVLASPLAALLFATAAAAESSAATEGNKQIVLDFYNKALNQKDLAAALGPLDPAFQQHNPAGSGGVEDIKRFVAMLREKYPNAHFEIKRLFADGDYVVVHAHAVLDPQTKGLAIAAIYKLGNGRILERWDVRQEIPGSVADPSSLF
jgi:predicted SnoaL-like aldol condensation-catalyzing enzyme